MHTLPLHVSNMASKGEEQEQESVREKEGEETRVSVYSKEKGGIEEEGALLVQKALNEAIIASGMSDLALGDETESENCLDTKHTKEEREPTKWLTITEIFQNSASILSPGELIHEPSFSLYDAMSAIELTDPKMDAIVQWDSFPGYPRSVQEAFEKGRVKVKGHSPRELIGIFDEMLACYATWLKGHTLAQTVFTCLYLLDTDQLDNLFLRAFSVAMVRTVEYTRELLARGGVHAEEDQQVICIGLNMLNKVSDETVLSTLKASRERLVSISKTSITSTASKDRENPPALIDGPPSINSKLNKDWDKPFTEALLQRVKFVRSLFLIVSSLKRHTREGVNSSEGELGHCQSFLKAISSTLDLGETLDPRDPLQLGFHPLINQHLLPPSYREYGIMPREESIAMISQILSDFSSVYKIGRQTSLIDFFSSLVSLCTASSSPNVLVRSVVASLCLRNDRASLFGSKSLQSMVKDEVKVLFNPPSLNPRSPLSTTPLVNDLIERFLGNLYIPYLELLRIYCTHRACQRSMISKYLGGVCEIQHESESVDQQLHSLTLQLDPQRQHLSCYCTWLVYYIAHLFVDYVILGFEYNLYNVYEYHYVYWYLEYSYGWKQMTLKTGAKLLSQEPQALSKNKKKVKGKKKELPKEREAEVNFLQVKRLLCIGIMRSYEALVLDGKIKRPDFEFGSEELIFTNRFLPFTNVLTPQPLTYTNYCDLVGIDQHKGTKLNLYEVAARQFTTAKVALESLNLGADQEAVSLLKVIKTNLVVMNLAATGHKRGSKAPPSWDFSIHRVFPIIRIN